MSITQHKPDRWLRLTSPYMKGPDVEALQRAIGNRLVARNRKRIAVDGEYGQATRDALRSTLWHLGMPADELDSGGTLKAQYAVRDPEGHRPNDWLEIARDRKAWLAEQKDSGREGFVRDLRKYVGKVEEPKDSNRGAWLDPLHRAAGFNPAGRNPYCAIGLIALLRRADVDEIGSGWAYTPNWMRDIREGDLGWKKVSPGSRQPGDIFFIKIPGVSRDMCDHVGAVESKTNTIEFNTSSGRSGSQNNGGGVWRRTWAERASMVVCVGRPPWNR